MKRTFVRPLNRWSLAVLAAATSFLSIQTASAQNAAFKRPDTPVAFIMDASRSMLGQVEGRRRMDVARDAMLQLAPGPSIHARERKQGGTTTTGGAQQQRGFWWPGAPGPSILLPHQHTTQKRRPQNKCFGKNFWKT